MRFLVSIVRSSLIGYSVLFSVSLGLAVWQQRLAATFGFPGWPALGSHLVIGTLLGAAVILGGKALRETFQWAVQLEAEFQSMLGPLDVRGAIALAAASGIAEETFFRATMQPVLGIWVTSFVFGLLHFPMNRTLIPWTILATVMGFVFGVVYAATGSLLAVSLGHGLINFVELYRIAKVPRSDLLVR